MATRQWRDGLWSEAIRLTHYEYAEDGRLLLRKDHLGIGPESPTTTYQYDYACEER